MAPFNSNGKMVVPGGLEPPHRRFGGHQLVVCFLSKKMVVPGGLEPPTLGL